MVDCQRGLTGVWQDCCARWHEINHMQDGRVEISKLMRELGVRVWADWGSGFMNGDGGVNTPQELGN